MTGVRTAEWRVPVALVALSLVPVAAGLDRLAALAGDPAITPGNARFVMSPLPVVAHIVAVTCFSLLGAFQFAPWLRRRHPAWHRRAGLVLVAAGFVAAASGLWMTLFYVMPPMDGLAVRLMRLLVGSAMIVFLTLGVLAASRRDFRAHRAWMMRAYGLGMGAGTQVLTGLPFILMFGLPDTGARALQMGAGWLVNILLIEYLLLRRRDGRGAQVGIQSRIPH